MKASQLILAATLAGATVSAQAVTTIGGIDFADNAFADSLISSTGSYTTSGGSLASVLTDTNPGTYAFSRSRGASVDLGFTDNGAYNLAGNDLAIFELGIPDTVEVTIGATTLSFLTTNTGFNAGGFNLNVAFVDFSDFGVAHGANLTSVLLGLDIPAATTVPSLSLVGALNVSPVPEPETYAMLLAGLGLIGFTARRRKESATRKA